MGCGQSTAGGRQQAAAGAQGRRGRREDNPFPDPMAAFMHDPPRHQMDDELNDEVDDWGDDDERPNRTLRQLSTLSRIISIKMTAVFIVVVACLGKDFLVQNSPYIADIMGWSAPQYEFKVPATSRMRVASFRVKTDIHSGSFNRRNAIELSFPNMTSIYPVRDMEQPDKLSHEFKVLVCDSCNRFTSTLTEVTELPPFLTFPMERKASSHNRITPPKKSPTVVLPRSNKTTGNVSSIRTPASRPIIPLAAVPEGQNGSTAQNATEAQKASIAQNASETQKASIAQNATEAQKASIAQNATEAQNASIAQNATEAQNASIAQNATEAQNTSIAQNATKAQKTSIAQNATEEQKASVAQNATEAHNASIAQNATEAQSAQQFKKRRRDLYDHTTLRAMFRGRYGRQNATRPANEDKQRAAGRQKN